ncbi:hypothetical protein GGX14DRAFT_408406 [Mycena pura]|uniref:Uncharacterized protein n=1 Tax=Mycena pura TaxID=153505 RepID=A0AAD6UL38_9AGAR|nr:hypothetical protein GGX14DRAFT_408406 [Mycena pura]
MLWLLTCTQRRGRDLQPPIHVRHKPERYSLLRGGVGTMKLTLMHRRRREWWHRWCRMGGGGGQTIGYSVGRRNEEMNNFTLGGVVQSDNDAQVEMAYKVPNLKQIEQREADKQNDLASQNVDLQGLIQVKHIKIQSAQAQVILASHKSPLSPSPLAAVDDVGDVKYKKIAKISKKLRQSVPATCAHRTPFGAMPCITDSHHAPLEQWAIWDSRPPAASSLESTNLSVGRGTLTPPTKQGSLHPSRSPDHGCCGQNGTAATEKRQAGFHHLLDDGLKEQLATVTRRCRHRAAAIALPPRGHRAAATALWHYTAQNTRPTPRSALRKR